MKILVLGGTGAMGAPLVNMLSENNQVWVTSRKQRASFGNVYYIQGNAKDYSFLKTVLTERYFDAVIDFMVWADNFSEVLPLFLSNTSQYVFISSARVYARTEEPIREETLRLLDVSEDKKYLQTNEYALAKAREENLLKDSGASNYTIIRPSITYNTYRLQLGVLEKESWLYRALQGRSIVFSEDIADKMTTMTWGDDVAKGISSVIGQSSALGETFHITSPVSLPWSDVLNIYLSVLEKHLGRKVNVVMTEKSTNLLFSSRIYQVIYCRYFNRTFDNSKIGRYCSPSSFTPPYEGLSDSLREFLKNPCFSPIDWSLEGVNDRAAKEKTPLCEIPTLMGKINYFSHRHGMNIMISLINVAKKMKRIIH